MAATKEAHKLANSKWYSKTSERNKVQMKEYRQRVKDAVFGAYGGYLCKCCGVTDKSMLCVDHVENDGYAHRKEIGHRGGIGIYLWLVKNQFPPGFQILCYNCNQSKRINKGVCSHKLQNSDSGT